MPRAKTTHAMNDRKTDTYMIPKRFPCDMPGCSKSFDRKTDQKRHILVHTGERPHVCPYQGCDHRFKQSTSLKSHMNWHEKAKPHVCGIGPCSQSFGDPSSCSRHRKEAHSGKIYVCCDVYCSTTIIRKTAFVHHLKTRHRLHPNSQEIEEMHLPHDVAQAKIDSLKPMGRRVADKRRQTYEPDSSPSSPESSYGIVTPEHASLSLPATPARSYTSSPMPMYNDTASYFRRRESVDSSPFLLASQEAYAHEDPFLAPPEPSKATVMWDFSREELVGGEDYFYESGAYLDVGEDVEHVRGWDRTPSRMLF